MVILMKTLKLKPKPNLKKFKELNYKIKESKQNTFYLSKDGLYGIGETTSEAKEFIKHPVFVTLEPYFDYVIIDANKIKSKLESTEWDVILMTEVPPFFYFDLLYEVK